MTRKSNLIKIGDKFSEWTVIGKGSKPRYYKCRCSCGVEREVRDNSLKSGNSKSCGHGKKPIRNDEKYIGNKFGRLTVIKRVNDVGSSRYLCKCDCGNEIVVEGRQLGRRVNSCGCLRSETAKKNLDKIREQAFEKYKESFVEDTNLTNLTQKLSKNNTTGIKGVTKMDNGKYRVGIMIGGKQKHLGVCDTLEEAEEIREEGEKKYYDPILEKYKDRLQKD